MALIRLPRETEAGGCRRCAVGCDRVVYPAGCVDSGCPRLYAYSEHGTTWVGCLAKVFAVEIDLARLEDAELTRHGFGGLRVVGEPLAQCSVAVDRTFEHRAVGPCRNPGFLHSAPPAAARAPAPPGQAA
ncbi:MAG: hypothetical protein MUE51_04140 [Thermoleophilia bacterium]|nr:hypothetical protein [Thermoleophilia bacterium]